MSTKLDTPVFPPPVILSAGRVGVRERKDLKMRKLWHRPCSS
jgi:hypothetical protein